MGVGQGLLKRRWSVAVGFIVLTMIAVVASVASWWTHQILFDTDTWMETVGPIGTNEVVTGALSDRFSNELIDWVDAENRLESLLPPILSPLAAYGAGFIDDLIVNETDRFFQSEFYANAWLRVNETAHRAAVAIIRDEVPNVSTADGVVTVDFIPLLTPIVDRVFARITEFGDAIPEVLLNQVDIDETIRAIITTYESEGLPERLGAVQVYSSDTLAAVQDTAALLDRLVWILPLIALVFAAGALYFAPSRWVVAASILGAAALGWFLTWLAVGMFVDSIVDSIQTDTTAQVAYEVFNGVTSGLSGLLISLAVLGVICALCVMGWDWLRANLDKREAEPTVQ